MPRSASAVSERHDDEAATNHVDDLVRRGRRQGYLMLPELRNAFEQANVTPAEARSILRELSDEGVQLGNEASDLSAGATAGSGSMHPACTGRLNWYWRARTRNMRKSISARRRWYLRAR